MPWWVYLIIACVSLGGIGAIIAALRSGGSVKVDREGLNRIVEDQLRNELKESQDAEKKVAIENKSLQSKLKQNQAWYQNRLRKVKEETSREENYLANNPDALDARIDSILGGNEE